MRDLAWLYKMMLKSKIKAPTAELNDFIAKFSPDMAKQIDSVLKKMRKRLPGAVQLVYDNYNFLVIGFGPTERPSEAVFSIVADAHGINLCFLKGAGLPDPQKLLRGSGKVVRNIRLQGAEALDDPAVKTLMKAALSKSPEAIDPKQPGKLIIRAVSAKQRPRRVETNK